MQVMEIQQSFKLCIVFFPAGDELHKSLSGILTGPGKTAFWVCQTWQSPPPHPFRITNLHKLFSVAQLSLLDFNLGTWTSQIANANKELPAAVPLDSRRRGLGLFFTSTFTTAGTEQDGQGARQELGGPNEEWGGWISTGQKGLGLEPVLCTGGVHGVWPAVRGQGKKSLIFSSFFYGVGEVINHTVRSLGEIELVVNGRSNGTWGR